MLHWLEATSQRVTAVNELAWHLCWGLYRNRRRLALANEVEGRQAGGNRDDGRHEGRRSEAGAIGSQGRRTQRVARAGLRRREHSGEVARRHAGGRGDGGVDSEANLSRGRYEPFTRDVGQHRTERRDAYEYPDEPRRACEAGGHSSPVLGHRALQDLDSLPVEKTRAAPCDQHRHVEPEPAPPAACRTCSM